MDGGRQNSIGQQERCKIQRIKFTLAYSWCALQTKTLVERHRSPVDPILPLCAETHLALQRAGHSPTEQLRDGWGCRQATGFDVQQGSE